MGSDDRLSYPNRRTCRTDGDREPRDTEPTLELGPAYRSPQAVSNAPWGDFIPTAALRRLTTKPCFGKPLGVRDGFAVYRRQSLSQHVNGSILNLSRNRYHRGPPI